MVKICLMFMSFFVTLSCYSEQFAIEQIEADTIDYKTTAINLSGHVKVQYSFGIVTCDKAILALAKKAAVESESGLDTIDLIGNVKIDFPDGDSLESDRAELDCKTMEGVFTSALPKKVVYITTMQQGAQKMPIKATSQKLKARLVKEVGATGYHLGDLQGEGAVMIEYLKGK